jgi:RNA polymerase sigma-70 factor, ECF subfamily
MGALYASQSRKMFVPTELMDTCVYNRLCILARNILRREISDHQFEPTDLVHEAFMRMAGSQTPIEFQDQCHVMAITTITMRRILIDNVRSGNAPARFRFVPIGSQKELSIRPAFDTLIIHKVLHRLEMSNVRMYQVVKMRFFLGLSNSEIASNLSVSTRTVKREWLSARLWLQRELDNSTPREKPQA